MIIATARYSGACEDSVPRKAVDYLIAHSVSKKVAGRRVTVLRTPVPETLLCDPTDITEFLTQLPFERKYLSLAATFAAEEVDVEAFNAGYWRKEAGLVTALVLDAAYAGIPTLCRPPVFANVHTHLGRLEINFLLPRAMINGHGHLRSFTPFPPQRRYAVYRYVLQEALIDRLKLIDPRSPLRTKLFKLPSWMHKDHAEALRAGLDGHSLFRLIDPLIAAAERGEMHGRRDLIDALGPLLGDIGHVVHDFSPHPSPSKKPTPGSSLS